MIYKTLRVKEEEDNEEIDKKKLIHITADEKALTQFLCLRISDCSDFNQKGFYLDDRYDWILGRDNTGVLVLVPLRK